MSAAGDALGDAVRGEVATMESVVTTGLTHLRSVVDSLAQRADRVAESVLPGGANEARRARDRIDDEIEPTMRDLVERVHDVGERTLEALDGDPTALAEGAAGVRGAHGALDGLAGVRGPAHDGTWTGRAATGFRLTAERQGAALADATALLRRGERLMLEAGDLLTSVRVELARDLGGRLSNIGPALHDLHDAAAVLDFALERVVAEADDAERWMDDLARRAADGLDALHRAWLDQVALTGRWPRIGDGEAATLLGGR